MTCAQVEDLLSPYLEGELAAEDKRRVDLHLEACPGCRSLLGAIGEARTALAGIPELEVSASLRARLREIPSKKRRFRPAVDFLLRPSLQPAFGAAAVLMTLVSFYLFGPNKAAIDRTIDRAVHQGYSRAEKLLVRAGFVKGRLEARTDSLIASLKSLELFDGRREHNQP